MTSFNRSHAGRAVVDAVELKAGSAEDADAALEALPAGLAAFVEVPLGDELGAILAVLRRRGASAKARTGGVVPDAIPDPADVARFLAACASAGVPFKATAGLHHPVRAEQALTYEPGSPRATMHGFLNVFAAAAFARAGAPASDLETVLREQDASAFRLDGRRPRVAAAPRRGRRARRRPPRLRHVLRLLLLRGAGRRPPRAGGARVIPKIDGTHDAALRSWVESANDPATDFPVQNLPLGVFRRGGARPARVGCAIGDQVLDLAAGVERGLLRGMPSDVEDACRGTSLNALMALEPRVRGTLRHRLSHLLRAEGGFVTARADAAQVLVRQADAEMLLPARVGDYTDFYASVFHATNVGKMLRPDNPLLPNYKWVPIGYHGRASSLVASGTPVMRPQGQTEPPAAGAPALRPEPQPRLRARGGRLPRPRQPARRSPSRWRRPRAGSSASASSTTGRPATCRSGSTSRSAPSSPRASRRR